MYKGKRVRDDSAAMNKGSEKRGQLDGSCGAVLCLYLLCGVRTMSHTEVN